MRFILSLLIVLSVPVYAQTQPFETSFPITCGNTKNLVDSLREKYQEEIVMMAPGRNASGDELYHSLWINAGTSSWTFIVVNKQKNTTCVIASGTDVTMFFPGEQT